MLSICKIFDKITTLMLHYPRKAYCVRVNFTYFRTICKKYDQQRLKVDIVFVGYAKKQKKIKGEKL